MIVNLHRFYVCLSVCDLADLILLAAPAFVPKILSIMKTSVCNEKPLTPHFYIVKRVNIFFLFLLQNIDCGTYNVYPQSMF